MRPRRMRQPQPHLRDRRAGDVQRQTRDLPPQRRAGRRHLAGDRPGAQPPPGASPWPETPEMPQASGACTAMQWSMSRAGSGSRSAPFAGTGRPLGTVGSLRPRDMLPLATACTAPGPSAACPEADPTPAAATAAPLRHFPDDRRRDQDPPGVSSWPKTPRMPRASRSCTASPWAMTRSSGHDHRCPPALAPGGQAVDHFRPRVRDGFVARTRHRHGHGNLVLRPAGTVAEGPGRDPEPPTRRYLPGDTPVSAVPNRSMRSICDRLNATPGTCPGCRTPAEVYREERARLI